MSGAHSTLKVHGAWVSVTRPTILRSTPLFRSQSGMAIQTRPSGIPDENESSDTAAVRGDFIAATMARQPRGGAGFGDSDMLVLIEDGDRTNQPNDGTVIHAMSPQVCSRSPSRVQHSPMSLR